MTPPPEPLLLPRWLAAETSTMCAVSTSSDCLLSDAESSSSDSPVADKRAPGSERAAERAAQQNERERIRLAPQTTFTNIQVGAHPPKASRLAEAALTLAAVLPGL